LKFIVAGSRTIDERKAYSELQRLNMDESHPFSKVTVIVDGGATGSDRAGNKFGHDYGIPVNTFKAEWEKYGNRAGPIRNNKMAVYADALVLIWDGKSKGSRHMKEAMLALNKPVYEIILEVPVETK